MNRLSQIQWWSAQMDELRDRATAGREARRGRRGRGLDDPPPVRGGSRPARMESAPAAEDLMTGRTLTGRDDEERRRQIGASSAGGGGPGMAAASGASGGRAGGGGAGGAGGLGGRANLLSQGYQPAVVKVISYAHGVTRATANGQYVQRDDAVLETHDGRIIRDKEGVAEEIRAWSKDF